MAPVNPPEGAVIRDYTAASNATNAKSPAPTTEEDYITVVVKLIDALRHDDSASRLTGVRSLQTIAQTLGEDRTRRELIPFLTSEVTDDDDEVLLALAEELVGLLPHVGGPKFVHCLIPPFEELCLVEETVVPEVLMGSKMSISENTTKWRSKGLL